MDKTLKILTICAFVAGVVASAINSEAVQKEAVSTILPRDTCVRHAKQPYTITADLKIMIEGEPLRIPADIGISNHCTKAIHTDNTFGQIHIIYSKPQNFTLKDFFAVWGKQFNKFGVLNYFADPREHQVVLYVDGKRNNDLENYVIKDTDQLIISFEHR